MPHIDHNHDPEPPRRLPFPPDGVDRAADECSDQLPLYSRIGRGIKGDSYRVTVDDPDTECETHLHGWYYDEAAKEYRSDWTSENVNGGRLFYAYNLRPYTIPRTFTMTFIYKRPGRTEWSWTTPAIPYVWTVDNGGQFQEDPDNAIVGSGVATLYIRASKSDPWKERLHYPEGTGPEDYHTPAPEEAWSATITFGKGGDVEVPNFDDLAKVLGITKEDIYNILEGNTFTFNGVEADNILDYVDKCDKRDLDHLHKDLGFNQTGHAETGAFGGKDNVKDYIDDKVGGVAGSLSNLELHFKNLLAALGDLIFGVTFNGDGTIKDRPAGKYVPTGNINLISPDTTLAIQTHDGEKTGDVKAQ